MTTITVVIPTHNRPDELKNALESLVSQTTLPDEVVIVDDGSKTPVTDEVFCVFPKEVMTKLITNEVARGANFARNRGIEAAKSEYISFLDDDDRFKHNKISTIKQAIKLSPSSSVFYSPAEVHMVKENIVYTSRVKALDSNPEKAIKQFLLGNPIGSTSAVTVKKASLVQSGLFDDKFPAMQDRELWLRLALNHNNFCLIEKPLINYYHVTNKKSITTDLKKYQQAYKLFEEKYNYLFKSLDKKERKVLQTSKIRSLTIRHLLNDDIKSAIKTHIESLKINPNFRNIGILILLAMGRQTIFKVRGIIS